MPHAALWVVQQEYYYNRTYSLECFNAARGFVGGATRGARASACAFRVSMPHAALWVVQPFGWLSCFRNRWVSMPHAALWVVQRRGHSCPSAPPRFQCRTRLCGWCNLVVLPLLKKHLNVSMPHAALWVVQPQPPHARPTCPCFNAARGFVGGATQMRMGSNVRLWVSMPHAALWVVQRK